MLTYHDLDEILIECDMIVEEIFADLEKAMLDDRIYIPPYILDEQADEDEQNAQHPFPTA